MSKFEWRVFADATFAGIAVLIPIPILDGLFEAYFRRRMPGAIARARNRVVSEATLRALGDGEGCTPLGCLLWPFKQLFNLLVKISRKILYFLTIKEATDKLSYYWHRAFLIDFMLARGLLADDVPVSVAREALDGTLNGVETSPVMQLAQQVVGNSHHALRSLWRVARRRGQDAMLNDQASLIGKQWSEYDDYWEKVAGRFERNYQAELERWRQAEAAAREAAAQAALPPAEDDSAGQGDVADDIE